MPASSPAPSPVPPVRGQFWLAFALVAATVGLSLSLACDNFQPRLDSDLLWPQVFAHDLGDPHHPVSGWMFGSATFFFPDYAIFLPLKWLCGDSGLNYPLYVVAIYLLTGAAMARSFVALGQPLARATIGGFLVVNAALLGQFLPGHGAWLWLLGIPCDHGSIVPTGFALLALTLGAARAGQWTHWRALVTTVLLALGLASNSLLLVHWVGPLFLALAWQARRTPALRRVLYGFVAQAAIGVVFSLALRLVFTAKQWFFFAPLLQYPPTPANVWKSFSHFAQSFLLDGVLTGNWMLWLLALAGIIAAWRGLRPCDNEEHDPVKRLALITGLLSLAAACAAPIATVYWVNPHSIRYLLNWLVLPGWLLVLRWEGRPNFVRWLPTLAATGAAAGLALSLPRIASDKLFFPRPDEELQAFCERHHFTQGLADFWHSHLLNVEGRFAAPHLSEVADDFVPVFWCNNVFDYFPMAENGRGLAPPAPQFVILDGLSPQHVLPYLVRGTVQIAQVGPYHIAVLTPEQSRQAGERLATQAKMMLQGRRAEWLETQLVPTR
jgi:hypothetical protein